MNTEIKNVMGSKKKKVAAIALASVISLSTIGTGAYAFKDSWVPQINKGVDMLASYIYKDDIQKAVDSHGNTLEGKIRTDIQGFISGITSSLQKHKQDEINRGKAELDAKYNEDKARAEQAVNNALATEKAEQTAKTNAEIQNEKNDMDAVVESELAKIPQ